MSYAASRFGIRWALFAMLLGAFLAGSVPAAQGAILHSTVTGEYGKEGPKATGLGGGCRLDWHAATQRLYVWSQGKIYGLQRTAPGTVSPLGGNFPIGTFEGNCDDSDIAVDNSATASAGNIYLTPEGAAAIRGFDSSGAPLPSPWPVSPGGGENCGVGVGNNGSVWGGYYSGGAAKEYSAAGVLLNTFPLGFSPCKIDIDNSNNDLFAHPYGSSTTTKFSAASGYTSTLTFSTGGGANPGLAVNGAQSRLYVANGSSVKAYDTDTGSLVEQVSVGAGAQGVAVDEATDTLFIVAAGAIKEITGPIVPDVTTGGSEGNSKVTGTVGTAGGGNVTECYFEFGTTTSYSGGKVFCSPPTEYATDQAVLANLPGLAGEQTYHYRLVAHNANGKSLGGDRTITPHFVQGVTTDNAENVTRTEAKLKGHFEGNGEATDYYFEWGPTTAYGTRSATPPGTSAGSPVGPTNLSFDATGLTPNTLYHYRVVATNPQGSSPGTDKTFKTLPAVQSVATDPATSITANGATLNGSYVGDGTATTYYYEYGEGFAYGKTTPVLSAGSPAGATQLPANVSGLKVDTLYHFQVVVTNSLGTTLGGDRTFTTKKAVENLTTKPATNLSQDSVTLNGEYEGKGLATQYYFEYGPTAGYGHVTAAPPGEDAGTTTGPTQLSTTIDEFQGYTTYHYRVVATNSVGTSYGADETFSTLPSPLPGVGSVSVTDIMPTTASLLAEINPNRWPTVYRFEWGPTADYGSAGDFVKLTELVNADFPVDTGVTDLIPGTVYHFRVIALNFTGTTHGPDQTFVTPDRPRIEMASASRVGETTARLDGLVTGNGSPTTVRFEYGTTPAYGQATPLTAIGGELVAQAVGADLTGLSAGETYHFRIVASNGIGTVVGADQAFTTRPAPESEREAVPPPRKCKKGFVKRNRKCVKRKKQRRHHHRHG